MLRIPVIRCGITKHAEIYQSAIKVQWLVPFLLGGYDPRSQFWGRLPEAVRDMYQTLQRTIVKKRREGLKNYAVNRMSPISMWIGAFPPIVIGMPLAQTFVANGSAEPPRGDLQISPDMRHPNLMLDGLGRVTAMLDAMDSDDPKIREWAQDAELPVMLITGVPGKPLSHEEFGQLFFDFNTLSVPVSQGQAVDLDQSNPYIQVAGRVCELDAIKAQGGYDARATQVGKSSSAWVTKSIMVKAVRAAAQGPGSHVDHVRDQIDQKTEWMSTNERAQKVLDRFADALGVVTEALPGGRVPARGTLLRTPAWWIAFGLLLNDLFGTYEGAAISEEKRAAFLRQIAKIDWGLGNPELGFLGTAVADKRGSLPVDGQGRPMLNRFHGGSKAYYNLAAFIRAKIHLRGTVAGYGPDYGASLIFDTDGTATPIVPQLDAAVA
jgi:hypothetical protein